MRISAYLTFAGNCLEAMQFYQKCLGGELVIQTIGESPFSDKMPRQMRASILHCTLTNHNLILMGSDIVPEDGHRSGNTISLMLDCSSEDEIRECYAKLSTGSIKSHPLEETFWGALFGDLEDKFGNHWLFHFQECK
ncbi:MAG: VOC family protein [Saprospiraceae bacterium]|nr:VOC family protein [Saprospiraceae bacterium]